MMHVFVGEDTFRSRAAYVAARERARGEGTVHTLRDETLTEERLATVLHGQSLFGAAPVVALEDITSLIGKRAEETLHLIERAPDELPLFVWESRVPDGRSKVWKFLQERATRVETFTPLSESELRRWITDAVRARGRAIDPPAVAALLRACGIDLWRLQSEIEKLCCAVSDRAITTADVAEFTPARAEANVFGTVRALATGDAATALRQLALQRALGDDARLMLSLTLREVRTLLVIRDLLDRRERVVPARVSRDLGVPSFVAEALLRAAQRTTAQRLRALFDRLTVAMYALNTGRAEPDDILDSIAFQALPADRSASKKS